MGNKSKIQNPKSKIQNPQTIHRHFEKRCGWSPSYLYGLQKYGIKFGLRNITKLLSLLGNPHKNLRAVHIGGTNGKGSTAAFIHSVLLKAGYRVGLYTSPHLVRFTERIQINQREIPEKRVVELIGIVRRHAEMLESITFFEFTTAMAFLYFADESVDIAVLEVGMGGRLDATNVVAPLLSIITNIALDHQQYLGDTISKIAFEKAGIIKKRNTLVTAATQPNVLHLFKERCKGLRSDFYQVGKDFIGVDMGFQMMNYFGRSLSLLDAEIGLVGPHQVTNATTALGALELLTEKGYQINETAVREGLRETRWPGRLEVMGKSPLVILDGAHNPAAMRTLKGAIERDFNFNRMILVLGIMADKDIRRIINEIVPLADNVILTSPHMERSASPALLKEYCDQWHKDADCVEDVNDAVASALTQARKEDLVLITGSLFTVGEARAFLNKD